MPSPRLADTARQPSRRLAIVRWLSASASMTVGIFASMSPATATTAPAKSRNITAENPNVVYRKMPKAGAPMPATEASS